MAIENLKKHLILAPEFFIRLFGYSNSQKKWLQVIGCLGTYLARRGPLCLESSQDCRRVLSLATIAFC
jgi:hypothetical protein